MSAEAKGPALAEQLDGFDVHIEPAHGFYLDRAGDWQGWAIKWRRRGERRYRHFTLIEPLLSAEVLLHALYRHDAGIVRQSARR